MVVPRVLPHDVPSVRAALDDTERDFLADVEAVPSARADFGRRIAQRIGFGRVPGSLWTDRFTPLALLYPRLQAEGVAKLDSTELRRVTLAHLYFLIFSVLDDRRRDAQITLEAAEVEYTGWVFGRGLDILSEFTSCGDLEWLADCVRKRYEAGQSKLTRDAAGTAPPLSSPVGSIVVGRSYWGLFATLALCHRHSDSPALFEGAVEAFEWLVWGLQWADDVEDWQDDIATGDDNLLLLSLDTRFPANAELERATSTPSTAELILSQQVIQSAISNARHAFGQAERIQSELKCSLLANLIRERAAALQDIERSALRECRLDATAYAISRQHIRLRDTIS